ncbi:fungal-specific transcription factor domain-containing protein [Xylariaceae sp. FL0662B]|nr:fungal-specific transcription factor domain-containing protein [Xylariaceae sp. FL0662B]
MEIVTPSDYAEQRVRKRPRRSGRPCDACRKAKTRCVNSKGNDPYATHCVHCDLRGSSCTFRMGPPARSANQASKSEARRKNIASDNMSTTQNVLSTDDNDHDRPSTDSDSRDGIAPSPPSTIVQPLQKAASVLDETLPVNLEFPYLSFRTKRFAELYGLGSDMEPILMRHRPYDPKTHEYQLETHAIRRVLDYDQGQQYPLTFHIVSDEKSINHETAASDSSAIERMVEPHGPRLIDLFWRHVQPCYPIIYKDGFMEMYNHSHSLVPAPLLGAMYLSALRWWSYDPELSIRPSPDSSEMRRLVLAAIQNSYHRPRLTSIQAILLLLQCQPEDPLNPDHTFDWGLTCQALAIGQCLGLHLDCSQWQIPRPEKDVRKRLSWALFMQDRWTALAYGRPVHIHDDDWVVGDLTDADFADCDPVTPQELDDERRSMPIIGKQQFVLMVRLSRILSDVLSEFYTARRSFEQDTVLLFNRAKPLLAALDEWSRSIPSSLGMHIVFQRRLSFHGYLHFSYYGVAMSLLRRLIRSTALEPSCSDLNVLTSIRQNALQVAQGAIDFVTSLRHDQLEAFWYFTTPYLFSLTGSFITLLLVTSLSSPERSFWQETLNSYLWSLRTMSKSCEPVQYAVDRLEGAILRGLEHALAVNLAEPPDDTATPPVANFNTEVLEYMDFGDWDLFMQSAGTYDMLSAAMSGDAVLPPEQPM